MKRFFWIDLEMTGLDENVDHILELAAVVTDLDFTPLETLHKVVFQPDDVLKSMNDWCKKTHGESGLTALVPKGIPLKTVEAEMIELIKRHYGEKERVVLAGNSISNDKRFIDKYMPEVAKRLHYRLIDVSSFKEVYRDKFNVNFQKGNAHRAVDDIHESIRELQFYLSFVHPPTH